MTYFKKYLNKFIFLGIILLTGCTKEDKYHFDMELDGNLSYIYPYDLNESEKENDRMQAILSWTELKQKYYQTDNLVDNNVYNFLFVLPIKTKTDLSTFFSHKLIQPELDLYCFYGTVLQGTRGRFYFVNTHVFQSVDGYYRYKLYGLSNELASDYYLNDLKLQKLFFDIHETNRQMTSRETLEITSNEINISAKEVENVLDSLGISHERLSFQPKDF